MLPQGQCHRLTTTLPMWSGQAERRRPIPCISVQSMPPRAEVIITLCPQESRQATKIPRSFPNKSLFSSLLVEPSCLRSLHSGLPQFYPLPLALCHVLTGYLGLLQKYSIGQRQAQTQPTTVLTTTHQTTWVWPLKQLQICLPSATC